MRSGIKILAEVVGAGEVIQRNYCYRMSYRFWLNKGEPVVWSDGGGSLDRALLSEDGQTLTADYKVDRRTLISGLFYGIEGMRIGGTRVLMISPHMAYRDEGVPGRIPANAVLKVEVTIHEERVEFRPRGKLGDERV